MTTPNSNRPILTLKPKVPVIPGRDKIVELMLNSMIPDGYSPSYESSCAYMLVGVDNTSTIPMEKTLRRITNTYITRKLIKLFPLAFFGFKEDKLPLAYGILQQVFDAETGISRKQIRNAIRVYAHSVSYHKGVVDNENRINLDGSIASAITIEDKAHAADRIAAIERG